MCSPYFWTTVSMLLIRFPRSKSMLWQYSIIGCTKEHEKTLRATAPSSNILLAQDLGWTCAELAPQHVLIFDMLLKSPGVPETPLCKICKPHAPKVLDSMAQESWYVKAPNLETRYDKMASKHQSTMPLRSRHPVGMKHIETSQIQASPTGPTGPTPISS